MEGMFHLAFATRDLDKAKLFYGGVLNCEEGRSGSTWIDYNFFGHQLTIQYVSAMQVNPSNYFHPKTMFPANHFGVILALEDWQVLKDKLIKEKIRFVVEPQLVFPEKTSEQRTLMIKDNDSHIIEFKTFEDQNKIFKKQLT